jgi:hypothetical protein
VVHSVAHPGPSWQLETATRILQSPVWYSGTLPIRHTACGPTTENLCNHAVTPNPPGIASVPRIRISKFFSFLDPVRNGCARPPWGIFS